MAAGSFVAGSTFLGGGAVAFPVMTKLLALDPVLARQFSLAIQSVGMSSAALLIILLHRHLQWRLLGAAIASAGLGAVVGLSQASHWLSSTDLKIGFSLFVCCFLSIFFLSERERREGEAHSDMPARSHRSYRAFVSLGLFSFVGGLVSGLIGSGADLFSFCVLFLLLRLPLRSAIQHSVIIMAACSLIGIAWLAYSENLVRSNEYFGLARSDLFALWCLAAPVVLIGAPLGVLFCRLVSQTKLQLLIAGIAALELASTLLIVSFPAERIPAYLAVCIAAVSLVLLLHYAGKRNAGKQAGLKDDK